MFNHIHIHNLRVPTIIGVYAHEKINPQDVIIDLKLTLDMTDAAKTDDLSHTVNYKNIHDKVYEYVSSAKTQLIEKLAHEVAELCLAESDRVRHVDVKISKPDALPGEAVAAVTNSASQQNSLAPQSGERVRERGPESIGVQLRSALQAIGEDPFREGLLKTPERVEKTFRELTVGYSQSLEEIIAGSIIEGESTGEVSLRGIEFYSLCEHHLLPFFGIVNVSYKPHKKIIGIGTVVKIVNMYAKRLQIQERLTEQIAIALKNLLDAVEVEVSVEATHLCMAMRGVGTQGARMCTSVQR